MKEVPAEIKDDVKGVVHAAYNDILHPSMQLVGKSLGSTLEFFLTPFAGLQFVNDKVKANLQHRLQQYSDKLQQIPQEKQCEVHPELGVPILQRLSYTTNDDVAELFLELLASASNLDKVGLAHPSFISIIDRLSPDEARILVYLKNTSDFRIPYVHIKARRKDKPFSEMNIDFKNLDFKNFDFGQIDTSFIDVLKWVTIVPLKVSLDFKDNIILYWANLISCGLLKDEYGFSLNHVVEQYEEIEKFIKLDEIRQMYASNEYSVVETERCFFSTTGLGKQFLQACIKDSNR